MGHAEDTFRGVILGVFNDFLDGDLEVIRTLLSLCPTIVPTMLILTSSLAAVNDVNPSIKLGEESINSVLGVLQAIRERALSDYALSSFYPLPLIHVSTYSLSYMYLRSPQ